jgi:hypothetical protein
MVDADGDVGGEVGVAREIGRPSRFWVRASQW